MKLIILAGTREQGNVSPYVFQERHFLTGLQSQHGRISVLPKFTDRSPLLRGIENYRVGIFESEPQTFVLPKHWDADIVFFVANGTCLCGSDLIYVKS